MRTNSLVSRPTTTPQLINQSEELVRYMQSLSIDQFATCMKISKPLAEKTKQQFVRWIETSTVPAADAFLGDIYSGLQSPQWSQNDWNYAQNHLLILSGLYGALKPRDGVAPYRLEMGYKLPDDPYKNLYKFWGDTVAKLLPQNTPICNLAANEYSQLVLPFISPERVITPSFLTINPNTGKTSFVVVHAKIARGAFANWLITNQIDEPLRISEFSELGYSYNQELSRPGSPVFICKQFGGIGLSLRLT